MGIGRLRMWISPYTWRGMLGAVLSRWGDGIPTIKGGVSENASRQVAQPRIWRHQRGSRGAAICLRLRPGGEPYSGAEDRTLSGSGRCSTGSSCSTRKTIGLLRTLLATGTRCVLGATRQATQFFERIPWNEDVRTVRVFRDFAGTGVVRQISHRAPVIAELEVRFSANDTCIVEWKASHPESKVDCALRFSPDDGETWIGVVPLTNASSASVPTSAPPRRRAVQVPAVGQRRVPHDDSVERALRADT